MDNKQSQKILYENFKGFQYIYLEESYVLNIFTERTRIKFLVDMVLCEKHPFYHDPLDNEKYCYLKGEIIFPAVVHFEWVEKKMKPIKDANNETDFGNIDGFYLDDGCYHIFGDWGYLIIKSEFPKLEFITKG